MNYEYFAVFLSPLCHLAIPILRYKAFDRACVFVLCIASRRVLHSEMLPSLARVCGIDSSRYYDLKQIDESAG